MKQPTHVGIKFDRKHVGEMRVLDVTPKAGGEPAVQVLITDDYVVLSGLDRTVLAGMATTMLTIAERMGGAT